MRDANCIGPKIRYLRNKLGISQRALAERLQRRGMPHACRQKISKIESRLVMVACEDLIYLAHALGVTIDEIVPKGVLKSRYPYDVIEKARKSRTVIAILFFLFPDCAL